MPDQKKLRKQLLDAQVEFLPLSAASKTKLRGLGFETVQEAFRAALAGRLSYRKKTPGKIFEAEVLEACCQLFGYQFDAMQALKGYRPKKGETVQDALTVLNGAPFTLCPSLLATSIREMFLPSAMHEALVSLRVGTAAKLLESNLQEVKKAGGLGPKTLGNFLALLFDYFFVVHEPKTGLPSLPPLDPRQQPSGVLDLGTRLLLAPWFPEDMLTKGMELLSANRLHNSLLFGDAAGGLFYEDRLGKAVVRFGHGPHLSHGFKIVDSRCDFCTGISHGQQHCCSHTAALVLRFLQPPLGDEPCQLPLPLSFAESPWQVIGQILFDLYGPGNRGDINVAPEGSIWRLTMTNKAVQSRFSLVLKPETLLEGVALFQEKFTLPLSLPLEAEKGRQLQALQQELASLALVSDPAEEEKSWPQNSWLEDRDRSLWSWLVRNLYISISPAHFRIHRPAGEQLFVLTVQEPGTGCEILNFRLPRAKTPEVVDSLARREAAEPVSQARAFSRAEFSPEKAALVVTPCLELPTGRVLPRADLEAHRYGRYYYLPEEGFISVEEQSAEQSLSGSLRQATEIPANSVPEFVDRHRRALLHKSNRVDSSLRDFSLKEMPDHMQVADCKIEDDWCYLAGHYGLGSEHISLSEILRARQRGLEALPGREKWLKLTDSPLEWFYNLGPERLWRDPESQQEGVRLTKRELLMLSTLSPRLELPGEQTKGSSALSQFLKTENWTNQHQLPLIPAHLRDYQRNGLAWLYTLYRNQLGGVLADDMGLGKTHQALGLLKAVQAQTGRTKRFLVVCPATVVAHWVEKIRQYYPELEPYIHHGSNRDLGQARKQDLLITTYGIIRRDAKQLAGLPFEIIIFDEIQHLKNKKTDVYNAAAMLESRVVVGLTGTPLENSVYDLKAIFDLCLPGLLGSTSVFKKQWAGPIEEQNDRRKRETLARLLDPFLLRRTRTQVLTELPKVIEDVRTCELSDDQVSLYREIIANRGRRLLEKLSDGTDRKLPYLEVLTVINYLKQICNHPCLVQRATDWRQFESGKWNLFVELLDQCLASSMKVVVFSHYTRMLDIIEQYLTEAGIAHCGLQGNMPLKKREYNIRRFNTDPSCQVFCASLLAGGVGVDLTAAQAVIHYDRWWNAAREDQATARVHRMGQKKVVQTFKLITLGTLEEKINRLIDLKRDLAQQLVREDDAAIIKRLSRDELLDLLEWESGGEPPAAENLLGQTGAVHGRP